MREIKLRGQVFITGNLYYFTLDEIRGEDGGHLLLSGGFLIVKSTIQQFTGLHDKSGKEIYEGDVIHIDDEEFPEHTYRVEWVLCSFYLCYRTATTAGRRQFPYLGAYAGYRLMQVIGNIYSTPELLS